jgi:hypothetical protein
MNEIKSFNSINIHYINNVKSVERFSNVKMEAACFSKPSVNSYSTTWRHIPEDSISLRSNNFYWTQNTYSRTLNFQRVGNEEKHRWIWGSVNSLDEDFWVLCLVHWSIDTNIRAEATKLHGVTFHKTMFFIQRPVNSSSLSKGPQLIAVESQGRDTH